MRRALAFLGNLLFVFYCTAVGVYLFLSPWTGRGMVIGVFRSGFFRGFVSGVGLVHLAAGVVDLRGLTRAFGSDPAEPAERP